MNTAHTTVIANTRHHKITIEHGHLTITGEGKTLEPDETQLLLDALLTWRYGLIEMLPEDTENEQFRSLQTGKE